MLLGRSSSRITRQELLLQGFIALRSTTQVCRRVNLPTARRTQSFSAIQTYMTCRYNGPRLRYTSETETAWRYGASVVYMYVRLMPTLTCLSQHDHNNISLRVGARCTMSCVRRARWIFGLCHTFCPHTTEYCIMLCCRFVAPTVNAFGKNGILIMRISPTATEAMHPWSGIGSSARDLLCRSHVCR